MKLLASLVDLLQRPRWRAPGLAFLVAAAVLFLSLAGVFRDLEYLLLDYRFTTRSHLKQVTIDPSIATIDWDEQTIQTVGRWPWTWDRHARLLSYLELSGAGQIILTEPIFDEPGPKTMARSEATELRERVEELLFAGRGEEAAALIPDYDSLLVEAIRSLERVVIAVAFMTPGLEATSHAAPSAICDILSPPRTLAPARPPAEGSAEMSVTPESNLAIRRFSAAIDAPGRVPLSTRFRAPLAPVAEAADGLGFVRIVLDPDGVSRRIPAMTLHSGRAWPHLVVAAAARRFGVAQDSIVYRPGRSIEIPGALLPDGRQLRIPIDGRGLMAVNWVGPYNEGIPHYPFLMIAEQIELLEAKRAVSGLSPADQGVEHYFATALAGARRARFLDDDHSSYIASVVTDAAMVEYFLDQGAAFEDFLEIYLEGTDTGGLGRATWNAIALNRLAARDFEAGRTPDFETLVKEIGAEGSEILRINFDMTLRQFADERLRDLRPLYHHVSPLTLEDGTVKNWSPLDLREKTLFVGLTATALTALNPTPFGKRYQMLGLLPNAFNTIVTGRFIRETGFAVEALFVLIYAWLVIALVLRLGTTGQLAVSGIAGGGHLGAAWLLFAFHGIVLPITAPLLVIVVGHLTALLHRYLEEERERRKVRGLFSAMVSPAVLGLLEDQPDRLALRGERKDATMFSSDVSGFTTISEGVTAQELANILNIYLTPMSNIIMKYDGFVDKYEGDAIKAEFGVPLIDPRHPWKGACAALEQQVELKIVARLLYLRYGVRITARMGVNTGIVAAGNMGSERKMQYTVMGDQVTLAEELEPINKLFESWIALGPETQRRVSGLVETRHLGVVRMGAAGHRVPVHEPLGWRREAWLEYWKGRPVPPLFVEGWRKMSPEKALGYAWFFERRALPDRPMTRRIVGLFEALRPLAMATMKIEDRVQIDAFRRDALVLAGPAGASAPTSGEATAWLEWCESAIKRRLAGLGDEAGLDDRGREEILAGIDVAEKRIACFRKRLAVTDPADAVALELAANLEASLAGGAAPLPAVEIEKLEMDAARTTAEIRAQVAAFLATLESPAAAGEFHDYVADLCSVGEDSLRLRDIFDRARAAFLERRWDEAEGLFREALVIAPDDGPSQKHLERIKTLRAAPPPAEWNGDWEEG
jgi:class 3 adenylate cyclase